MRVLVVTNMYPNPAQPAFGTFVQDQVQALQQAGAEIDVLFINGRKNKIDYVWAIPRFWKMLLRKRYDLIHAHYAMSGFIARLQFLYPVVVTYHGGEVKDHSPFWLRSLARRGPKLFDRVIVMNRKEKEILHNAPNVQVIPCGVDLNQFKPAPLREARRALGLPNGKPLVLWAGEAWQSEKRFELVKAAMQILKQHRPSAELVLVSGKPHSTVPTYMNACDVLVLTSWSEGSPMVIKEAMACNLPIVSTNVGDVAEVIAGVEGCYLTEPTAEQVADKLMRVLETHARTTGRDNIQRLGSRVTARHIVDVYNEISSREHRLDTNQTTITPEGVD